MSIAAPQLEAWLGRSDSLAPFWLATGSEPLLMLESGDLIRHRAKELGYSDRQVLEMSGTTGLSSWMQQPRSACSTTGSF